jgi:PhnB protein
MYDPARGFPKVVPYLRYSDPEVGIRWFADVLGATEVLRLTADDGRIGHVEFTIGSSVITLGLALTPPGPINPEETRFSLRQMTLVYVDDLDASVELATRCGGSVLEPPTDQPWGLRQAVLRDPEGYLWELSKHIRDVLPSEWGAVVTGTLPG